MTSSGIFINSYKKSSGETYDGAWNLSNDVEGFYNVIYTHLEDGDIPICYEGVNALTVVKDSDSSSTVIHFDDLFSDTKADVEGWLEDGFGELNAALSVTVTSATGETDGSFTVVFSESVTLKFSLGTSTLNKLFGAVNLTGDTINLTGVNINNRPKFIGVCIAEANQIYAQAGTNNVNCLIAAIDELVKGVIVYIPTETSTLNIKLVRLNAPDVACPITFGWNLVLQKNFNAGF